MPNPKINWLNDHTHICDRLDTRVQLMEDYINGKSDDFDGSTVKRSLLGQAREQITWYRQSIDALDFVGAVACRRALESGQPFLEHYLPTYNFRETERGTEYKRDTDFPILPAMWSRPSDDDDERFPDVSETPDVLRDPPRDRGAWGFSDHVGLGGRRIYRYRPGLANHN